MSEGWYSVGYVRKIRRGLPDDDYSSEDAKGPYRWRWIAALHSAGTWSKVVKVLGDWYIIGSRVERR